MKKRKRPSGWLWAFQNKANPRYFLTNGREYATFYLRRDAVTWMRYSHKKDYWRLVKLEVKD